MRWFGGRKVFTSAHLPTPPDPSRGRQPCTTQRCQGSAAISRSHLRKIKPKSLSGTQGNLLFLQRNRNAPAQLSRKGKRLGFSRA